MVRAWCVACAVAAGVGVGGSAAAGEPPGTASAQPQAAGAAPAEMESYIRAFREDEFSVRGFYDLDASEISRDRREAFYMERLADLGAIDFATLAPDGAADYLLLRNHISDRLNDIALDRRRAEEMDAILPFRAAIVRLEESRRRMERPDPREAAEVLDSIARDAKAAKELAEKGHKTGGSQEADQAPAPKIEPVVARRAADTTRSLRNALRGWFTQHDGYQPEFAWWTRKPHEEAAKALEDYAKYLRETIAGQKGEDDDPLVGDPIGRDALLADLANEMIAYSPEELIQIAEIELAWCEDRYREAAAEMGHPPEEWREALNEVKRAHAPPGEQDAVVASQAREAIAFLRERGLVTIPELCEETWRLSMIGPETQRTLPFAAYGGQRMLVAYPTDAMRHDDKLMSMRGNNTHFSRIVVPHELIPGHHLQAFMASRHRAHRAMFRTPFFVEGWAVYWELTLWDEGYPRGPRDRIGMLFWRAHRCARIIVSLRFHLGEMTPEEMIDFLVERVGHERHGATSEVRRYIGGSYSPLYQCAYMIGALQLRALRREVVDAGAPGGLGAREFHDTLLTYNAIPIELIRAEMLGVETGPHAGPRWRFYGD